MNQEVDLMSSIDALSSGCVKDTRPRPMEVYGQSYGLILYQTNVPQSPSTPPSQGSLLHILDFPRDRATVFVDSRVVGVMYRTNSTGGLRLPQGSSGQEMSILVENMGRLNYGGGMKDPKGITEAVTVDGVNVTGPAGDTAHGGWNVYSLPLKSASIESLQWRNATSPSDIKAGPRFFRGSLPLSDGLADTYLSTRGLCKGYAWINGILLGRYWDVAGPQHTLYVPSTMLKTNIHGEADVVILEMEPGCRTAKNATTSATGLSVYFVDTPDLDYH